jgi:amidase
VAIHRFEATQWHSALAKLPAALSVGDGDTVITETIDANGADKHGIVRAHGGNPMNGPIHVEGAAPGDVLQVDILRMTPMWLIPSAPSSCRRATGSTGS